MPAPVRATRLRWNPEGGTAVLLRHNSETAGTLSSASESIAAFPPLRHLTALARLAGDIWRRNGTRSRTQRDAVTAFAVRVASAAILYLIAAALMNDVAARRRLELDISIWARLRSPLT